MAETPSYLCIWDARYFLIKVFGLDQASNHGAGGHEHECGNLRPVSVLAGAGNQRGDGSQRNKKSYNRGMQNRPAAGNPPCDPSPQCRRDHSEDDHLGNENTAM